MYIHPNKPVAYAKVQRNGVSAPNERSTVQQLVKQALKNNNVFAVFDPLEKKWAVTTSLDSLLDKEGFVTIAAAGPNLRENGYKALDYLYLDAPMSGSKK